MRFSKLFKLSSACISAAFTQAHKVGSISGIKLMRVSDTPENRFIIALTKQIKGSVKRNAVRRRVKAALTLIVQNQSDLPHGIWLCIAYEAATQLSMHEIISFLQVHLCHTTKTH